MVRENARVPWPAGRALPGAVVSTLLALGLVGGAAYGAAPDVGKAPREVAARAEKGALVARLFTDRGLPYPAKSLLLRSFKRDAMLEMWAGASTSAPHVLVKSYPVCAGSGGLGPKRREGDLQVPEGFYRVTVLNPRSDYHLSLGIDYPNASDRILSDKKRPGSAIMIHGDCVTIGCIPLEDEPIEEVFLAVLDARKAGLATVPVHVFPTRLDAAGMEFLRKHAAGDAALLAFWENLREGYAAFEATKRLPKIGIDKKTGRYRVTPG